MSGALAGKVALVTGAARGIGRAIAIKLATEGCDVAVNYYNSADDADALVVQLRALGRRAVAIQGSVGIPDSVDEIFAEFGKHFDRLDIVVSNAASGVLKPTIEMGLKHWRWCMETNALALNLLAQRALPLMPAGGRIIAMSSLGCETPGGGLGHGALLRARGRGAKEQHKGAHERPCDKTSSGQDFRLKHHGARGSPPSPSVRLKVSLRP